MKRVSRRAVLALAGALCLGAPVLAADAGKGGEILWDRYGVAHVYARDNAGLFYGYGWAQTKSHGDALLKLYAQARGRGAEYYGPAELKNDRWMAVNDVPAQSQRWLAQQKPEFRRYLEAFAAGINAYAAAHPDSLSPQARRVLPVSARDVVGHALRLFQYVYLAPATVADTLPADAPDLNPPPPAEPPGSNGWAIAPSRSESGRTMMLMNPHLPWETGWPTYYEIQLQAPGIDLYGASQLGLPVLRFVFSDYLAFTQTVNTVPPAPLFSRQVYAVNGMTLYKVAPAAGGYRFDGAVRPFGFRKQTLKVLQPGGGFTTEAVTVRTTVHGPVVAERDGAPVALRVVGLDRPFALEQYWQMATAQSFAGYEAAVRRLQVPTFNIVYADRDGHIQYLYNGLIPRRPSGGFDYWTGVVPGDRSDTLWTQYLGYDQLPKATDPPTGIVQNSNEPPWHAAWPQMMDPAAYPATIPGARISLRAAQGMRLLNAAPKISYERLVSAKWSTRVELADRVLPALIEAAQTHGTDLAKQAAQVLSDWDRTTQADSRGSLLFLNWSDRRGAASGYGPAGFAVPFAADRPLTTPSGLADPKAAAATLDAAARDMLSLYGALDKPWGDVMRLRGPGVDLPASGGPGRLGMIDVIDFAPLKEGARSANMGASYMAVVSFDRPTRAKVLLSYGNASQPGSSHRSDQLPLLSAQTLRDAWRTRAEVEANLESREIF
jgi:acyl-homoserine-lactone acylase